MKRKVLGVSSQLHKDIAELAKSVDMPMTACMESLIANADQLDWPTIRLDYNKVKPSWDNIKRIVAEYLTKYPDSSDKQLSELTGYTLPQVETVTHSAHKRCIKFYLNSGSVAKCSAKAKVSLKFAQRIKDQKTGKRKIPRSENHLWHH